MDIGSVRMKWFYDKFDAGGGQEVEKVIQSRYGYLLRISGVYPHLRNGFTVLGLTQIIIYTILLLYAAFMTFRTSILVLTEDLNLAVQYIHFCILSLLCTLCILVHFKNRGKMNKVHLILRDNYYQYDDGYELEELESRETQFRSVKIKLALVIPIFFVVAAFTMAILPLIEAYFGYKQKEIQGLDMRLPVPLWHPFSRDNPITFYIHLLITASSAFISGMMVSSMDVVFILTCYSIVSQFKILHQSIELLQVRAEYLYKIRYQKEKVTEEKMKSCYMHCIKQNVQHHVIIENVFREFFELSALTVGLAIFIGSVIIAASLIGFILGNGTPSVYASSLLLLIAEIANMGMLCYFGQQIRDHSSDLGSALYNTNWDTASKEIVSSIKIMMEKSKHPLEAKALGIWPLNYDLFTSIMNSAYSSFNVILGARSRMRLRNQRNRNHMF